MQPGRWLLCEAGLQKSKRYAHGDPCDVKAAAVACGCRDKSSSSSDSADWSRDCTTFFCWEFTQDASMIFDLRTTVV